MATVLRTRVVVALVVLLVASACTSNASGETRDASPHQTPHQRLAKAIGADLTAHPAIPGEAVSVHAPGLDVEAARGLADVDGKVPLRVDTPFRIASVTKTFVAASLLRLVEEHKVALDVPIAPLLSHDSAALLTMGGYRPDRITVRQLLDHTSGLFDYASSTAYDDINTRDPGHQWNRREQLQFAMDRGTPVGAAGAQYHYADTNYILLGEIIERATLQPLAGAVRELIGFERIGLDHTFWETFEPAPPGQPARAHQYYDTTFDNITLDSTSDLFGGGGLVSTVGDLTRFYRALFDGEIFTRDASLDAMLTVSQPGRHDGAALGIFATDIAGQKCWGHPGYWGTEAYYCPKLKLAFAIEMNQADEAKLDTTNVEHTIVDLARQAAPR